ncbi:GntR family transcriptional regulator [Paracoccus sp. (in: a-proteobacteria)]|uniref:GntR family transcriptional regulator n=1 Tax=Paracoccus sp. TaxID=267 RepID=UPI003A8BAD69
MGDPDTTQTTVPGLGRVGRSSLQQRVYEELATSLMHGAFAAGQVLRMQALANTLGVSVMPVREALARLVSERALEVMPNRSTRVPLITAPRLEDLARARRLIEGELVRRAIPNLGADIFALLRQQTHACEAAFARQGEAQPTETSVLNHEFHFTIYRAATSDVLLPIVRSLWMQSGPYVRSSAIIYGRNPSLTAMRHHWALIGALEAGDAVAAIAALHADITQSFDLIRAELNEVPNG